MSGGDKEPPSPEFLACLARVDVVLPAICPDFVARLAHQYGLDAGALINAIVDAESRGSAYPRRPMVKDRKRKRRHDADEDSNDDADDIRRSEQTYGAAGREPASLNKQQLHRMRHLVGLDFPLVSRRTIYATLDASHNLLLPAYLNLYNSGHHPSPLVGRISYGPFAPQNLEHTMESSPVAEIAWLMELQAARRAVAALERTRGSAARKAEAERHNLDDARAEGLVRECECCFSEVAMNRLAECNAEEPHWFCLECCRRQAESLVGLSQYKLKCMSMDDCSEGFSHGERQKFLEPRLAAALDRLEQEEVLRLADLDNLVTCPFCPFAAECSPVEVDKEFRCQNPDCELVSCRLCLRETHLPLSCEEATKERGFSARRTIEEAMSAAVIRRCNKCGAPFIKDGGCNKMTCARSGCGNVQCYICSKSCDYAHFNDPHRGGRTGNCPLFDVVDSRHARDIWRAEQKARQQVVSENPEVDPNLLDFHMSDKVFDREKQLAKSCRLDKQDQHDLAQLRASYGDRAVLSKNGERAPAVDEVVRHDRQRPDAVVAPIELPNLFPMGPDQDMVRRNGKGPVRHPEVVNGLRPVDARGNARFPVREQNGGASRPPDVYPRPGRQLAVDARRAPDDDAPRAYDAACRAFDVAFARVDVRRAFEGARDDARRGLGQEIRRAHADARRAQDDARRAHNKAARDEQDDGHDEQEPNGRVRDKITGRFKRAVPGTPGPLARWDQRRDDMPAPPVLPPEPQPAQGSVQRPPPLFQRPPGLGLFGGPRMGAMAMAGRPYPLRAPGANFESAADQIHRFLGDGRLESPNGRFLWWEWRIGERRP
ncbi:hypothetical protein XA68_11524 [Ophiocordyceps unilateralis]|uniref:RING-type domain-containing protein n=1 Tax=Ophiocordyceps unilateralis TaxID=268505 RepID=A0A2A9PGN9_OPHUN|nr:hypothetical protein XA68_11524 [Ophiocordyceps unilateralis]